MSSSHVDGNLLFGSLALQMDFISRDELVAAIHAWVLDKKKSLGQILVEQGALERDAQSVLDALVKKHLELHHGDPQQSLAAVGLPGAVQRDLNHLADPDLEASLVRLATMVPKGSSEQTTLPMREPAPADARFEILRSHAWGGLGEVFVAQDREVNREVALKRLHERHTGNADSRARFLREGEITGQLEHPGIVPIYGLGMDSDGRPYYAMRFIRGQTLKEGIEQFHSINGRSESERRIGLRQLLARFIAVCNAIGYAHSRGVIHRDLKPSNIMLGKYGETLVVDWGLCKALGHREPGEKPGEQTLIPPSVSGSSETLPGSAIGTPSYMSPEQSEGRLDAMGPTSDVYSLGATLYAILTGKEPFESSGLGAVLAKVQAGEFVPPRDRNPSVTPALNAVCLKAMSVSPKDRYPSCAALASDVEHWLADEPVEAYPEPWPTRARRRVRQHRMLVTGVTSATVVAAVGLWVILATRAAAERREAQAQVEADHRAAEGRQRETEARTAEAESYERNGLIESERGNREDALVWFEKSRDTLGKLELTDRFHRERLARLACELANLSRETGRIDRAGDLYREAIKSYGDLVEQDPSAAGRVSDVAQAYVGRANVRLGSGHFDEALGDYERALDLERRAIALAPEEPRYLLDLAALHNGRSLVHERRADFAAMERELEHCRKVIKEAQALPAMKNQAMKNKVAMERRVRRDRAVLHENQGNLYSGKGKLDEALAEYAAARELAEGLSSEEPGTLEYEMITAKADLNAGYAYFRRGNGQQASASLAKALNRLRNMYRRFPRDDEIRFAFANCLSNQAAVSLTSINDLTPVKRPEALRQVEEYVDEANRILTGMKSNRKDADQIALLQAANYIGLGMLRYKREEWDSALRWFDRGLNHCQALEKSGQASPGIKMRAVLLQGLRALIYYRLERFSEALADINEALQKRGDPVAFGFLRAGILAKSGKHREGTAAVEKLIAISSSHAKSDILADAASVFSVALEGLAKDKALSDTQRAEIAHGYAARSVDLLRQAIKAGYTKLDKIREPGPAGDRDLDPLRSRDEFKKFLEELPRGKRAP
jgi:serine/threonine protein kinase/tetratricopeptide (TPR) repeat protein